MTGVITSTAGSWKERLNMEVHHAMKVALLRSVYVLVWFVYDKTNIYCNYGSP